MSTVRPSSAPDAEERHVLYTDWAGYLKVLALVGDGHTRVTYDQGKLELMAPSEKHESDKSLLGRLLESLMDELGIDYQAGGSTTFKSEDLYMGLEPDECYWIANCWRSEEHPTYDPTRDPPPDLAIEVEITRSAVDRMEIYRALGVPEVWRWTAVGLRIHRLNLDGEFETCMSSPTFPALPVAEVERYLRKGAVTPTSRVTREFRAWVRQNLADRE